MNTQTKTKKPLKRARKQPRTSSKVISLVHAKRPILRHFRLVEHKHTGKLIHLKHTSHLALMGILILVGFFLFISDNVVNAVTQSGDVTISVVVPGPPPTIGATITSPLDGDKIFDQTFLDVSGTCQPSTFVTVYDNDQIVGSDICTNAGIFGLQVQIEMGKNVLTAMDFDNINQPGPVTSSVTIISAKKDHVIPEKTVVPTSPVKEPILPINPSIIPGVPSVVSSCDKSKFNTGTLPSGGDIHVAVVCIPRLFGPKVQQVLGILVWGGTPPYVINIDWGDGLGFTAIDIPTAGYYTESFNYAFPGIYRVEFLVKDKNGVSAKVQSSVQVNGVIPTTSTVTKDDSPLMSWLRTPVSLYIMAITITLGFWGGNIFIRR